MSKQQDVAKSKISPVLFMTVDGEPMPFFLRPGPVKRKLQPLITAGGGLLCNVQQPGAILLINPQEKDTIPDTTAHWYVSTQYIHDCIEQEEQLNLEDYRLNPEVAPRISAILNNSKEGSPGLSGGRVAYTPEDDAAILSYVSKHKTETGGNRLWQEMEKQNVTSHSWQSMKYRYRVRLAKKLCETEEVNVTEEDWKVAEEETKDEQKQETDIQKPSCVEDAVLPPHLPEDPPQMVSSVNNLVQIHVQSESAEITTESIEARTLSSPHGEVQCANPQTDAKAAESTQVETVADEVANSLKPEGPCLNPETDVHPTSAESTEPQSVISPQNESVLEDSLQSLPDTPSLIKRKVKASPKLEQPQRRITRRQLELEASSSPEPYGKKLRSSSTPAEKPSSSPLTKTKTKSSVKSAHEKDTTTDQPPSKKARGESVTAVAESQQGESEEAAVPETPRTDEESNSLPQKGEKKKEKRKLGILELATKEFEDESECGEDETPDLQNPAETATVQPPSADSGPPPPDTAAGPSLTQSNHEPGPNLQTNGQEVQAPNSSCVPETGSPKPAAMEAVHSASRVHLFIFDSESQEDNSQSHVRDNTGASAEPVANNNAALSLTQTQLEEDKQRIKDLMNQTNQDIGSVTKALLKTSGDFSAALNLLLHPSSFSGPFWTRDDDSLLLSADPVARQQLQEKYGEDNLAKRVVFLEVQG